jgi:hypothetical protein
MVVLSPTNAVGCGILGWYQSKRQAFKLFNDYRSFCWPAGPLFVNVVINVHLIPHAIQRLNH